MVGFEEYFLRAQQEGHEVYIGNDVALVVYEQDKTIGIQGCGCCDMFLSFGELGDLEKELAEIRTPDNLKGIQPGLTQKIREMWRRMFNFYESNDQYYLNLFFENR